MDQPSNETEKQIEAAYDFRGYVTLKLKSGEALECYLFNRQYAGPHLKEEPFIEIYPKGSEQKKRIPISQIAGVTLTGEDFAAGKSYEDYLKKQQNQPSKPNG